MVPDKFACHPCWVKTVPPAFEDGRISAEAAAESASLRGDVVELAFALASKVVFHISEAVIMSREEIDIAERSRWRFGGSAISGPMGATCHAVQRIPFGQPLHNLRKG